MTVIYLQEIISNSLKGNVKESKSETRLVQLIFIYYSEIHSYLLYLL